MISKEKKKKSKKAGNKKSPDQYEYDEAESYLDTLIDGDFESEEDDIEYGEIEDIVKFEELDLDE